MSDLDIIEQIRAEIGVPFRQMTLEELNREPSEKGIRGYVIDKQERVTALRLCNTVCRNEYLITQLKHVQTLSVQFNGFDRFDFLSDLPELKKLHLAAPYLEDFRFLRELVGLTSLDLYENQINDGSFLSNLTGLTSLSISCNQIRDCSFLNDLTNLTSLNLSGNQICDITFLGNLTGLTALDLSNNQIENFSVIEKLTRLTMLDLSNNNKITDFSFLSGFTSLTSLVLIGNQISDASFLGNLTGLNSLFLSRNKITDFSFLRGLTGLSTLAIIGNQAKDISFMDNLTELTSLYLSGFYMKDYSIIAKLTKLTLLYLNETPIRDVSFLNELTRLNSLSIRGTYISDISPLCTLSGLTTLDLSNTQINDISILCNLNSLTSLDLSKTKISDITALCNLTKLTVLDLSKNRIKDISPLGKMVKLTSLYLGNNQIDDISVLKKLKELSILDIGGNEIQDISPLSDLIGLTVLDLSYNQISDISFLSKLVGLTCLYLNTNEIHEFSILGNLTGLTLLDLGENQVSDISFIIKTKNIMNIDAYCWELDSIPSGIWNDGAQSIRRYLLKTIQSSAKLYEAKTLFVGQPEAGKTSLMRKLVDPNFPVPQKAQQSTLGVDIVPDWSFPLPNNTSNEQFKAHFWDFGGQTIQYYIHQFFLTTRSLYILLLDDRRETGNLDYWFNIIRVLGGLGCPVIVVRNEKNITATTGFDEETWRRRYGEHLKLQFLSVNLANISDGRLTVIANAIRKQLCSLPHVGEVLPTGWVKVREQLAGLTQEKHITHQQLCELFEVHGIKDEKDKQQLCGYLTDLGIIHYFPNDSTLADIVFVNSAWLTNAVYQILSDKILEAQKGRFTKEWLFKKWGTSYTASEKNKLLLLMQKKEFDLMYPIECADQESYIAPRLLPDVAPEAANNWKDRGLSFRYRYPFMPEGIISRFIVRMYEYIASDTRGALVWANGVILERYPCRALVKKDLDLNGVPVIDIDVQGKEYFAREFLAWIRDTLDTLHRQSYKNAARELLLPCCCENCRKSNKPFWFELSRLKKYLDSNQYVILCENGNPFKQINITAIVSNIVTIDRSLLLQDRENHELYDLHGMDRNKPVNDEVIRFIMELTREQRQALFDTIKEKEMKKTTVFVSYSHKDEQWRDVVWPYLNALKNMGYEIDTWVDNRQLKAGQKWKDEIQRALNSARIGLCLVSMNFLNSDFIMKHELPELLKNAEAKGTHILFLNVERSIAHLDPRISQFQHVNKPEEPLKKLKPEEQEEVLIGLAELMVEKVKENV